MATAIDFAVRDFAGATRYGSVAGDGAENVIAVESGDAVSLNISQDSVVAYEHHGADLLIRLADGRSILLTDYFHADPGEMNRLFLSADDRIVEVLLHDGTDGLMFADYGAMDGWTPLDDLRFVQGDAVAGTAAVAGAEAAGMAPFVPGLLGGLGGAGTAAAAIGGGAAVITTLNEGGAGPGGNSGGPGGSGDVTPTVDAQSLTRIAQTTMDPHLPVSGTGAPGATVVVTLGNVSKSATIGGDGSWAVDFAAADLPADGLYDASVIVTPLQGRAVKLAGPELLIDRTAPDVAVEHGTKAAGDLHNAADYADGISIDGQAEPGAAIAVQVGAFVQRSVAGDDGSWSVIFPQNQIAAGEYEIPVTITATDAMGNSTVISERLVIDTLPNPIGFNPVTADDQVNFVETQAGLVVSGTSAPGAQIALSLQGVDRVVVAAQNGQWSATYPVGTLPGGEYTARLTATTTDAAGNTATASHDFRVDTLTNVGFTGPVTADNVVNATEAAAGVVLTGTAQAGAVVSVAWNGLVLPATVAGNGAWSVTFPGSSIPAGSYGSTATVTATDAAGNTATAVQTVQVDTQTTVAVNAGQFGGDNTIAASERAAGVALTGTAEPGARVVVVLDGISHSATASQNGAWTVNFAANELRSGSYTATASITATDLAGNTATASHVVAVDTEVRPFARSMLSAGADGVMNGAEAAQGLTVTGTVEPGSTVVVGFGNGAAYAATVAPDGSWTATVPATALPAGETVVTLTALATDRLGNTALMTEQVQVDTLVNTFNRTGPVIGGDGLLNMAEAAQGLTLGGTVEAGATVVLRLSNGAQVATVAGANGGWSASFAAADLPYGETASSVTMTATDRAGNTAVLTETFRVDTLAPAAPEVTGINKSTSGTLRGIYTAETADTYSFHEVKADGSSNAVGETHVVDAGETAFTFAKGVPDGSYLVVNAADAAGNDSSTLLIVNNTNAPVIDLNRAGLAAYDLSAIDLSVAPQANLTITEAQLRNITGADHSLMIKGGADDHVTLIGGAMTDTTKVVGGETYKLYTLGSGASVYVDDHIITATTAVI